MKISFVLPPLNLSGGIKVALIYAKRLAEMGHTVTVVSAKPKAPSFKQIVRSLLKFKWRATAKSLSLEGWSGHHLILSKQEIMSGNSFPDADVVVATWWETAEWVASLRPSKGAKAYFIQGHEVFDNLPVDRVKATYRQPFHRIVISKWLMRTLQDAYGLDNLDLVPNSYDSKQFYASERNKSLVPTVGFLYSETVTKGTDVVIAAIDRLQTRFPNLRVISFGTAVPKGDLLSKTNFEFHLMPRQDAIRTLYSQCDVWMTGSRSEGFNLTALEAMACRTPLVSTRTGWPFDAVVDGQNGFLVDVDDIESLALAVGKVLELSDGDWQNMSRQAYVTASSGSWEASAKAFETSLLKCTALHSSRSVQ
jgi:glycosyltransferase involved in cell wall biosynthesis